MILKYQSRNPFSYIAFSLEKNAELYESVLFYVYYSQISFIEGFWR